MLLLGIWCPIWLQSIIGEILWFCIFDRWYCLCWNQLTKERWNLTNMGFVWRTIIIICSIYILYARSGESWSILQFHLIFEEVSITSKDIKSKQSLVFFWFWTAPCCIFFILASVWERKWAIQLFRIRFEKSKIESKYSMDNIGGSSTILFCWCKIILSNYRADKEFIGTDK